MISAGLHEALLERDRLGRPVRVGLIGAGTFGTMFLRQALRTPGIEVTAVADLDLLRAANALVEAGCERTAIGFDDTLEAGRTVATADPYSFLDSPLVDVVVEATGSTTDAVRHVRAGLTAGKDVVNVTVEADALVGPALAAEADERGLAYSLAYGDQPALICELVDWARLNGFDVVCAGKGTRHQPGFERTSPDTVWSRYGLDAAAADAAGYDRRMFTSFVDGTKSSIEMAAVAAATGLAVPDAGLRYPAAGTGDLAQVLRPRSAGGQLSRPGCVEVVSSLQEDGAPVMADLRWGVFVVIAAPDAATARQFRDYGLAVDDSGRYAALWRPNHLVGMELITSVASVGLFGVPTGTPRLHAADVVAVAKRDLPAEMELDGEGGYTVSGRLMPARIAQAEEALPIGLAHGLRTTRHIPAGHVLTWHDVEESDEREILALRAAMASGSEPGGRPGVRPDHELTSTTPRRNDGQR